jgi:MYXO-CTERM domain-containing protein
VAIVKSHLVDGVAVSDLCDQHQILPTQLYQWQKQLFENGGAGFLAMTGLGLAVRRRRQGGDRL